MGFFSRLFGAKAESPRERAPEPPLFTKEELDNLAREIDAAYERVCSTHDGMSNVSIMPCFPKTALLSSASIVELCRKSKKDARDYIMSFYNQCGEGEYPLHKIQCRYVLSLWIYERFGANIPDRVISFVGEVTMKEPDDCEYLIKLEHLW